MRRILEITTEALVAVSLVCFFVEVILEAAGVF